MTTSMQTRCQACHEWHYCRLVRKPKWTGSGWVYPLVWLCEWCVYNVETL